MWILVLVLLLLAAQCSLTAFAPAPAGKAWLLWPFAADAQPILPGIGGLPQSGSVVAPLLAGLSALASLLAVAGLFGLVLPGAWWPAAVLVAGIAGLLLAVAYIDHLRMRAILPVAASALLLAGVIALHWTPSLLRGL